MISSVQLSNILPDFVRMVNRDEYKNALDLFTIIKSDVMIIKTQYGKKNFDELDKLLESIETSLRWRMRDVRELTQKLLYILTDLGIPVK